MRRKTAPRRGGGGVAAALCLPALLGGMTAGNVFASLFKAVFALPEYAAGVPNFESVIPRAAMEEMPQYGLLKQIRRSIPRPTLLRSIRRPILKS